VATVKHHRGRPLRQQRIECNKSAVVVRQQEIRHRIADLRRVGAATAVVQALHQLVDRGAVGRKDLVGSFGVTGKPLMQRRFEIAVVCECLSKAFINARRVHPRLRRTGQVGKG